MINEYTEEDIFFYYVDADGNETMLPATSLRSSDDTIVSLSSRSDSMAVHVQALDPATATISYEHTDGVTYTMPMYVVSYGTVGFYEDTSRGTQMFDYYISSLPNDTFYFVPDDAWTLTSVSLDSVSEDFADITLDPSGKFATIEITDTTLKGMSMSSLVVNFDARNGALISTDNECWMTVNTNSMMPAMGYLSCVAVDDPLGMLGGSIYDAEGTKRAYYFYYTDASNTGAVEVTLNVAGWTEIYYMDGNGDYYSVSVNVYSAMSPADPSAGFYTDSMGSMQILHLSQVEHLRQLLLRILH